MWELDQYGKKRGNLIYQSDDDIKAIIPYKEDILIVLFYDYVMRVSYDSHTVVETYYTGAKQVGQAILIKVIRNLLYREKKAKYYYGSSTDMV